MRSSNHEKRGWPGRKPLVLLVFPLLLLILCSNGRGENKKEIRPPKSSQVSPGIGSELVGKPAPDFTLASMTGTQYRLSDFKGKVVLIDFWHTY